MIPISIIALILTLLLAWGIADQNRKLVGFSLYGFAGIAGFALGRLIGA